MAYGIKESLGSGLHTQERNGDCERESCEQVQNKREEGMHREGGREADEHVTCLQGLERYQRGV